MTELRPPPTVFQFAPDVPEGVEVYSDPNCVRITVAPPAGRKPLLYLNAGFAFRMVFTWCWGVGLTYFGWSAPMRVAKIFLVLAPFVTIAFSALWVWMRRTQLSTPTIFSIRDLKSFRVAVPGQFQELTWLLYEPEKLSVDERLLRGYPPATRQWVEREFKRAGQWAYDWLNYRVTIGAAAERANKTPQPVLPVARPVATEKPEGRTRITSLGVGPRVLDYPVSPPRGNLRYETLPDGVAIIAPPQELWTCGIVFRVILALLYAGFLYLLPLRLRIAFALIGAVMVIRSIRKLSWLSKQKAVLSVVPGKFLLEDLRKQRGRRIIYYDKVRAVTAYLYRPDYNYVGIHTTGGDRWFGHRCNEDEIRWLGQFILARVGIAPRSR